MVPKFEIKFAFYIDFYASAVMSNNGVTHRKARKDAKCLCVKGGCVAPTDSARSTARERVTTKGKQSTQSADRERPVS